MCFFVDGYKVDKYEMKRQTTLCFWFKIWIIIRDIRIYSLSLRFAANLNALHFEKLKREFLKIIPSLIMSDPSIDSICFHETQTSAKVFTIYVKMSLF